MPLVASDFVPPPGFGNGHVQTILGAIRPCRLPKSGSRERLELPDGDFLDLDWFRSGHNRLAILTHGLEGNSTDGSMGGLAYALHQAGWDVLAWNFRGCSGQPNRLLRSYHSGETEDLGAVIGRAAESYQCLALVGFSLGGNATLKYLGEAPPHPSVKAAVAVSAPIDLASSARVLDQHWANRFYLHRFMKSLTRKIAAKAEAFPGQINITGLRQIRSFREFDERFTARLHGFHSAEDYWARCSARAFLPAITIPTLLLSAQNDPFLAAESFPIAEAEKSAFLYLEMPKSGGHLGFLDTRGSWAERRIAQFLQTKVSAA